LPSTGFGNERENPVATAPFVATGENGCEPARV
jgi:hypothetical protein